jgi:hypothetical protein
VLTERLFGDRHHLRKRQAVDRDDVVAPANSRGIRLGPDGEPNPRRVARRHCKAGAAAKQQL